jgi:heat shock protein HtpX
MNGIVYWKSDTIALKANGARELRPDEAPRLRTVVADLARSAGIPVPRLYVVDRAEPNAFATGRDPRHAAVAVTTGLLELMDDRQLAGVLAHELSHVKNRDTLVGTVAATIGGAVSAIAQMGQFALLFGGRDDEEGGSPAGALLAIIVAPIAALIVQLSVSRGREYLADASGAALTRDPEGLAQALEVLEADGARRSTGLLGRLRHRGDRAPAPTPALNPAFAHLYFANPLSAGNLASLFATHPPLRERIRRLRGRAA